LFTVIKEKEVRLVRAVGLMCYFRCVVSVLLYGYVSHGELRKALKSRKGVSDRYLRVGIAGAALIFLGFAQLDFFI
jgi:hypothetical protein